MHAVVLLALLAADVVPFFHSTRVQIPVDPHQHVVYGPELPDPIATECGVRDKACLAEHDLRVVTLAADQRDPAWCDQAVDALACRDAYALIVGDVGWLDPILTAPCTYVVRTDHGAAVLYSKAEARWVVTPDRGWHAPQFVGICKDPGMPGAVGVQTLPAFPWVTKK
jgi:hypothetical protein